MKYDYKALYEKNAAFFTERPKAKKALKLLNLLLTWLFFVAYALLLIYATFIDRLPTKELVAILFVPLLCLTVVSVLRLAIDRPRPYEEQGAGITPLFEKKSGLNKSFPSRHLACATVIAMTFLAHMPIVGGFLLFSALLLAYVRFACGVHYPSDLLAGIGVGVVCGALLFVL